jgi:ubiquinone/menaquinone biosynthesis C-methylase UbiE
MQRTTLAILRCPRCQSESLIPESTEVENSIEYGPARCLGCASRFSISDGLLDFQEESVPRPSPSTRIERSPMFARSWESTVRPALDLMLSRGNVDAEKEYEIIKTFLGDPQEVVVDLGCGTGRFLRRLSRDVNVPIIGVDASKPMLNEALDQAREDGWGGDLIRTSIPPLPFVSNSVGAVIATGLFHAVKDLKALLLECRRVLKPQGRVVATSYFETGLALRMQRKLGFFPRTEAELFTEFREAGFISFERVQFGQVIICKAELP